MTRTVAVPMIRNNNELTLAEITEPLLDADDVPVIVPLDVPE
jgi:hypothetical protein